MLINGLPPEDWIDSFAVENPFAERHFRQNDDARTDARDIVSEHRPRAFLTILLVGEFADGNFHGIAQICLSNLTLAYS